MPRLLITLDEQERSWLERTARKRRVSMAQVLRQALKAAQESGASAREDEDLLRATQGIRRGPDGLETQLRLRREWA